MYCTSKLLIQCSYEHNILFATNNALSVSAFSCEMIMCLFSIASTKEWLEKSGHEDNSQLKKNSHVVKKFQLTGKFEMLCFDISFMDRYIVCA